jgi:hypothetical protein
MPPSSGRTFIALKMKAVRSSETSVSFKVTTRRYIPEDSKLQICRCENLKSHMNWKICGRIKSWPEMCYYVNFLEGLRKITKTLTTAGLLVEV